MRVDDVLASGYVIAQIAMMPNAHARTIKHDMTVALARSFAPLSDFLSSMAELRRGKGIKQID
jgi:acetolactate synthase regulatory subunit